MFYGTINNYEARLFTGHGLLPLHRTYCNKTLSDYNLDLNLDVLRVPTFYIIQRWAKCILSRLHNVDESWFQVDEQDSTPLWETAARFPIKKKRYELHKNLFLSYFPMRDWVAAVLPDCSCLLVIAFNHKYNLYLYYIIVYGDCSTLNIFGNRR